MAEPANDTAEAAKEERTNLLAPDVPRWDDPDTPIIELIGVRKAFGDIVVFDDLNLSIKAGQTSVIMGESGSGKSVLLKLMNGLMTADEGEVRVLGIDMAKASRKQVMDVRRRISTLFQNYALIDSMTVEDNIAFPLEQNTKMKRGEIMELVGGLLELLELPYAAKFLPSELSGGMKKRVSLARSLITNPEVVLFDEPTTGLDPVMIEFVDDLLIEARRRYGITGVVISHDMASAFRLADRMAMIHDGGICFEGTPDEARTTDVEQVRAFVDMASSRLGEDAEESAEAGDAADDAQSGEADAVEVSGEADANESDSGKAETGEAVAVAESSEGESGIAETGEAAAVAESADDSEARAGEVQEAAADSGEAAEEGTAKDASSKDASGKKAAVDKSGDESGMAWDDLPEPDIEPVVEIRDVYKAFGKNEVLRGVNFYVEPNRITTLIGGSGSGKSVMMKHVLGLMQASEGKVSVLGKSMSQLRGRELTLFRRRFGMLFQSAALFDSMNVRDNLEFPLREQPGKRPSGKEIKERAQAVMEKLHIADLAKKMPSEVSGGQRKRIGLARAIVTEPELMIFDEPTTGLDPVMTAYVNDMIVEAQESFNLTALIVSHDMASTFRISHKVAMLYKGRIIAFDTPEGLKSATHPRVREFIFAGSV